MKNLTGTTRGYHRFSKAWYHKSCPDIEINFGMFDLEDGGTTGEMSMVWQKLGGKLVPQLRSFDDSWAVLASFSDLIVKMGEADEENLQEKDFAKMLDGCGFKDLTIYECPYDKVETPEEDMITLKLPKGKAGKLGILNHKV